MANKRFVVRHGLDNSGDTSATNTIINVAEPVNNSDAATKYYVDTHATGGTVTAVTATSPVESTGGTTPVISLGTGTSGQLVIGTGTGFTKSTLTAGSGVSISNGSGTITISATGSGGDVTSPNPSTDNAVVRFDGTTGKVIQTSTVTLSDTGVLTVPEVSTTSITSTDNNAIVIAPDGAGHLNLQTDVVRIGDNAVDATLTTRSTGDLILTTHEGSATQGVIRLYDGANGNITLTPNGTGQVQVGSDQVVTLTASQTLTNKSLSGSSNTFTNIPNSATTATSSNTASAIVARDASGNFSAGTITATLSGNASNITASSNTSLTSLANLATVGTITSGTWTAGTIGVSYGGTGLTTLTAGYIPYGNGTSAFGSSANLFWDSSNSRLGIGTTSPNYSIDINGAGVFGINNAYGLYTRIAGGTLKPFFATAGTNTHFYNTNASGSINWSNAADSSILMTLTDAGSLGLGTTSPASKLNVSGSNVTVSAGYGIAYSADQNRIMTPEDNVSGALISWGSGGICRFREGSSTERMRIDSSGNVGIGTSSPATPLHVFTTNSNIARFTRDLATDSVFTIGADNDGTILESSGINVMRFVTNSTERMRITSGGNVLIGATSQAYATSGYMLGVQSGGVQTFISIAKSGQTLDSGGMIIGLDASTSYLWANANIPISFGTNATERMRIDSSGNVGIGTASPSAKLQVVGTTKIGEGVASNSSKLMVNTVSGVAAGIQLFQDTVESWIIQNPASITALTFSNSGTERMRIDGSGNVGIGTTTNYGRITAVSTGYSVLALGTSSSSGDRGGAINFLSESGNADGQILYDTASDYMKFSTNGSERMRIDSTQVKASAVFVGNGATGDWSKGFGGIKTTSSTSTPTGGQSGDFVFIY